MTPAEKTNDTVFDIITKVTEQICDKYCKFPSDYREDNLDNLLKEHCDNCPFNQLM